MTAPENLPPELTAHLARLMATMPRAWPGPTSPARGARPADSRTRRQLSHSSLGPRAARVK
jgi:hypothetical protein